MLFLIIAAFCLLALRGSSVTSRRWWFRSLYAQKPVAATVHSNTGRAGPEVGRSHHGLASVHVRHRPRRGSWPALGRADPHVPGERLYWLARIFCVELSCLLSRDVHDDFGQSRKRSLPGMTHHPLGAVMSSLSRAGPVSLS